MVLNGWVAFLGINNNVSDGKRVDFERKDIMDYNQEMEWSLGELNPMSLLLGDMALIVGTSICNITLGALIEMKTFNSSHREFDPKSPQRMEKNLGSVNFQELKEKEENSKNK